MSEYDPIVRYFPPDPPTPKEIYAEHVARSVARAEAWSVARFRLLREAERIASEVAW